LLKRKRLLKNSTNSISIRRNINLCNNINGISRRTRIRSKLLMVRSRIIRSNDLGKCNSNSNRKLYLNNNKYS
jgi:hypothetical protein